MPILLVQLPVSVPLIDNARFPDRDDSHIVEHLTYYLGKFEPLPAVTVTIEGKSATVVRGQKYLLAAKALGRRSIRAVVASPLASNEDVKAFLARADVTTLDLDGINVEEKTPKSWHVFFFDRALSGEERRWFSERVCGVFSVNDIQISYDDSCARAEFEADTPVGDPVWAVRYLEALTSFNSEVVAIRSYQGRRFVGA